MSQFSNIMSLETSQQMISFKPGTQVWFSYTDLQAGLCWKASLHFGD